MEFFNPGSGNPNDDVGAALNLKRVASDPPGQLQVIGQTFQAGIYSPYTSLGWVAIGTPSNHHACLGPTESSVHRQPDEQDQPCDNKRNHALHVLRHDASRRSGESDGSRRFYLRLRCGRNVVVYRCSLRQRLRRAVILGSVFDAGERRTFGNVIRNAQAQNEWHGAQKRCATRARTPRDLILAAYCRNIAIGLKMASAGSDIRVGNHTVSLFPRVAV